MEHSLPIPDDVLDEWMNESKKEKMKLPDKRELDIMWTVATSSAIEDGGRPHLIFARLLYSTLTNEKPRVTLGDKK